MSTAHGNIKMTGVIRILSRFYQILENALKPTTCRGSTHTLQHT